MQTVRAQFWASLGLVKSGEFFFTFTNKKAANIFENEKIELWSTATTLIFDYYTSK